MPPAEPSLPAVVVATITVRKIKEVRQQGRTLFHGPRTWDRVAPTFKSLVQDRLFQLSIVNARCSNLLYQRTRMPKGTLASRGATPVVRIQRMNKAGNKIKGPVKREKGAHPIYTTWRIRMSWGMMLNCTKGSKSKKKMQSTAAANGATAPHLMCG